MFFRLFCSIFAQVGALSFDVEFFAITCHCSCLEVICLAQHFCTVCTMLAFLHKSKSKKRSFVNTFIYYSLF